MLRAEKRREVAQSSNQEQEVASAEVQRKQMSDAADRLAQQIMIIERIMEEFGLTLDLEEETRVGQEELMESKEMYEGGLREAEEAVRDVREGTYVSTMAEPFMMPSDVYDEDEAMRDLDETAKQTGLT